MAVKFFCCCCCEQTSSFEEFDTSVDEFDPSINPSEHKTILRYPQSASLICYGSIKSPMNYDRSQGYEKVSLYSSWQDLSLDATRYNIQPSPPALECFIIPSFGEDPPGNVAVKLKMSDKMASKFLKGVGEDLDIIQKLIMEDDNKQLLEVRLMCHFAQKKVEEFKKAIGDAMKNIKLKRTSTQKGCKYNT